MNKQAIQSTAISYWCDEDQCFIVQSPLMESIIGAGDSIEEAARGFNDILSDAYQAYLEGRLSSEKPGRPAKNRIALNIDVKPETRQSVKELAIKYACSQGEVIDYLLAFHQRCNRVAIRAVDETRSVAVGESERFEYTVAVDRPETSLRAASNLRQSTLSTLTNAIEDLQSRIAAIEDVVLSQRQPGTKSKRRRNKQE